jgi:hypothetical protein
VPFGGDGSHVEVVVRLVDTLLQDRYFSDPFFLDLCDFGMELFPFF